MLQYIPGEDMTVYLDVVFLENIIINYIILYVTGIISKANIKQKRILFGAIIGAIYSVIYYLFKLKIYSSVIIKIVLSIIIIYVSFNSKNFKDLSKKTIIAYFTIIIAFNIIKTKISKKDLICDISIILNNKIIKTKAMIDTGNLLKEPITNKPVIVMEHTLLYDIIPKEILNNIENILGGDLSKIPKEIQDEYVSKLKVIPFSSLGKTNGMLLGIKGENLTIYLNEETKIIDTVIIGIYNKSLTKRGEYRSLLGLEIL